MLLVPIGQESESVRRIPWITVAIIGLCILIHILNMGTISEYSHEVDSIYYEIKDYYMAHPHLELDQGIKKELFISEEMSDYLDTMSRDKYSAGPTDEQIEEQQAYLDNLVDDLNYAKQKHPFFKFGLVPKKKTFVGLIGHMFFHVGWLHLLGNLLYLYLLGPFIEDAWGKPAYAVFYLVTGIGAALAFAAHYPNSGVPMIGASGAISGVMGGFLIRFWHARIKYFYWIWIGFFMKFGTFSAPAWVILPIGFIMEFINASIMDSLAPGGGGGVAHWAHVWGFIFGVAAALAIKFLKIEEKFVAPKIEAQTSYVNKGFVAYEEAMQVLDNGDKEKAFAILMDAAREDTSNQDVIETLWNIAVESGREGEAAPLLARLIEREVQQDRLEAALFHYRQLRSKVPHPRFATHTKIKIFEQTINIKDANEAKDLFNELINEVNLASPPGLVMELCTAAFKFDLNFDQSLAGKVVELALQHPEIPDERKESLKQQSYAIPQQKKDAPIKVDSQYDYDLSQLDSKGDMGGVSGTSSVSGASSLLVPLAPTDPKTPSAPQEPEIPTLPSQSQPPPIPQEPIIPIESQEPEIPLLTQEPTIPTIPSQSQPPPIFEEPVIPRKPQEPEIPQITQEPTIPTIPSQSQPPPVFQDPPKPIESQEPTIPTTPSQSQPPPIFEGPTTPIEPREPEMPLTTQEPISPMDSIPSQPPPMPIEPVIPIDPQEPEIPVISQEPVIPPSPQEPIIQTTSFQSQPPPIPQEPPIPIYPQEPEIPVISEEPVIPSSPQEPIIPTTPSQSQPPPPPIEPVIPIKTNEPTTPIQPGEPVTSVRPEPPAEDMSIPSPPPKARKSLKVTKAVPLGVKGGKIALKIKDMGKRIFALEKIQMIAVVKISPPGERPFLLIDLFVDDPGAPTAPTAQEAVIRTLRLLSTNFNPQKFVVSTQGPLEAFKIFTSAVLKLSKAKPFPDSESVQLKKVTGYRSINEYEDSLLRL